jgi:hypothetical protein
MRGPDGILVFDALQGRLRLWTCPRRASLVIVDMVRHPFLAHEDAKAGRRAQIYDIWGIGHRSPPWLRWQVAGRPLARGCASGAHGPEKSSLVRLGYPAGGLIDKLGRAKGNELLRRAVSCSNVIEIEGLCREISAPL